MEAGDSNIRLLVWKRHLVRDDEVLTFSDTQAGMDGVYLENTENQDFPLTS